MNVYQRFYYLSILTYILLDTNCILILTFLSFLDICKSFYNVIGNPCIEHQAWEFKNIPCTWRKYKQRYNRIVLGIMMMPRMIHVSVWKELAGIWWVKLDPVRRGCFWTPMPVVRWLVLEALRQSLHLLLTFRLRYWRWQDFSASRYANFEMTVLGWGESYFLFDDGLVSSSSKYLAHFLYD